MGAELTDDFDTTSSGWGILSCTLILVFILLHQLFSFLNEGSVLLPRCLEVDSLPLHHRLRNFFLLDLLHLSSPSTVLLAVFDNVIRLFTFLSGLLLRTLGLLRISLSLEFSILALPVFLLFLLLSHGLILLFLIISLLFLVIHLLALELLLFNGLASQLFLLLPACFLFCFAIFISAT